MIKLYSYWRSSAAYRVRIALNLKNIEYKSQPMHLATGEHRKAEYLEANPQGLVPALEHNGEVLFQSLAIIEYLDQVEPSPRLLPLEPVARARVAGMAQAIACEIHPLNNLRVTNYLRHELQHGDVAVQAWYEHWIDEGFAALESWATKFSTSKKFLYGNEVSLADVCLVPQMYNARRFNVDLRDFPGLVAIDAHLQTLPAVVAAGPERQPDAG